MNKNLPFLSLLTSVMILVLASCWPGPIYDPYVIPESRQKENLYYVPTAPNTHLLTEKNDADFNLIRSGGTKFSGVDVQASYLPGRHMGVVGSFSYAVNDADRHYMKYNQFETGIGYITPVAKRWHFETYAGLGTGKINNAHATGSSVINLSHLFIQPAVAVSNKEKTCQLGFISKISGVKFKVDTAFDNEREPFSTGQVKALNDKPLHVIWEPGLVFRFGWKNFLFHTSYSYSADLTNSNLYRSKSNFSIGGGLRFNVSAKKNTRPR